MIKLVHVNILQRQTREFGKGVKEGKVINAIKVGLAPLEVADVKVLEVGQGSTQGLHQAVSVSREVDPAQRQVPGQTVATREAVIVEADHQALPVLLISLQPPEVDKVLQHSLHALPVNGSVGHIEAAKAVGEAPGL